MTPSQRDIIQSAIFFAAWFCASSHAATSSVDAEDPRCTDTTGTPFCSLPAAVGAAQAGDTIVLSAGRYTGNITIDKTLNLQGDANGTSIIDGQGSGSVLRISPGVQVSLAHLTLQNGAADDGAGILNQGNLHMSNCVVQGNTALHSGGGIYSGGAALGNLTVENSMIRNNTAEGDDPYNVKFGGGGIFNDGPMLLMSTLITGNHAVDNGGGIYSVFSGRRPPTQAQIAAENMGIPTVYNRDKTLRRVVDDGAVKIVDSSLRDNEAEAGGGIDVHGVLDIANSIIDGNRAIHSELSSGGGIYAHFDTHLTVTNTIISRNRASYRGGGLRFFSSAWGRLFNATIIDNRVGAHGDGGGIFVVDSTVRFEMANSLVARNYVGEHAGSDCNGKVISLGFNLLGTRNHCNWSVATGDQLGEFNRPLEARIEWDAAKNVPLLLPDSPAVDAGDPQGCTANGVALQTDQRGAARPVDGNNDGVARCDVGAIERQG